MYIVVMVQNIHLYIEYCSMIHKYKQKIDFKNLSRSTLTAQK